MHKLLLNVKPGKTKTEKGNKTTRGRVPSLVRYADPAWKGPRRIRKKHRAQWGGGRKDKERHQKKTKKLSKGKRTFPLGSPQPQTIRGGRKNLACLIGRKATKMLSSDQTQGGVWKTKEGTGNDRSWKNTNKAGLTLAIWG